MNSSDVWATLPKLLVSIAAVVQGEEGELLQVIFYFPFKRPSMSIH